MSNPDGEPGGKTAGHAPETVSDHAANSDAVFFAEDIEAGQILAEILGAGGETAGAMDDLHAVLASIPEDTYLSLDDAAHHLTTSVDLFDVPAPPESDVSDHGS